MPALNEEGNLASAVATVRTAFADRLLAYELIVFDDGSSDGTGALADALALEDPHVVVVHHRRPMGIGRCYWEGVGRARFEYVLMVPGDNEVPREALDLMVDHAGAADVVVPYFVNPWVRPLPRRLLSRLFTLLVNSLFGLKLRYYNGPCIIRTELIRSLPTAHDGFAYMAAILARLAVASHRVVQVGVPLGVRHSGRSKAVSVKHGLDVCRTMLSVYREVRELRQQRGTSLAPEAVRPGQEKGS
jgi:glycosyltransferase involved in cell wall biosynthesis